VRIFETSLEAFSPGVPTSLQDHVSISSARGISPPTSGACASCYAERCEALLEGRRADT